MNVAIRRGRSRRHSLFFATTSNCCLASPPTTPRFRHENLDAAQLSRFFIGPHATHTFANEQSFDFESLKGRLLSSSYAPAEGQPLNEPVIAELRRIFDLHQSDGQVCFEYNT